MYERPDVPKDSPNRNKVAVIVLLAVAVALVGLVMGLWRLANANSALGSSDVEQALSSASSSLGDAQALAEASGATVTGDEVETVLFVVLDGSDSSSCVATYLAAIDSTQGSAKLIFLPLDALLTSADGLTSVADTYAAGGLRGLAESLASAAAVPVSHAITMTQDGWNAFLDTAQQGSSALKRNATRLVGGIVSSDLDATGLLDIAQRAVSLGVGSSDIVDAPVTEDYLLDAAGLACLVGVLA